MHSAYITIFLSLFGMSLLSNAHAFTPDNHVKSIVDAAKLCQNRYDVSIDGSMLDGMIDGVLEPDRITPESFEMVKQRFEPGSYGKQREMSLLRIAAQSFHGSPNPTRRLYTGSKSDQELFDKTIPVPPEELDPNRFDIEVYSYDTNRSVRNKILINASQFLCISLTHKNHIKGSKKFGNLIHMIGDTYSASHVQRTPPEKPENNCGTEKIEWHFSMDLISWKQHRPADKINDDWRFKCLISHTADLMREWNDSREVVQSEASDLAVRETTNKEVKKMLNLICRKMLREDNKTLDKPSGGAAKGYSSASGSDNWDFGSKKREDKAIVPLGLTSPEEAHVFYQSVGKALKDKEGIDFYYPRREMEDLCKSLITAETLPEPLACTDQEIGWARRDSEKIDTMWMPSRY